MAHVVELFGAPGTGKSSLMRALSGRRAGGRRIVGAEQLIRVPRRRPIGRLWPRELTPGERRAALADRRDDWAELLGMIAASPIGSPVGRAAADPLRVLHAPGWVADSLQLRALAAAAPDDLVVVLDEGLVQRAPVVCGEDPDDATIADYLRRLPPAALHVHLTADPATLLARLRGRERVIDRHVGLADDALVREVAADLARFTRIAGLLEAQGAPLLRSATDGDAEDDVDSDAVVERIVQALG
jgi:hypothetical protein